MSALPFPDPPLTDGVVLLRAWQKADGEQRLASFSDELCLRFSWPELEPPSDPVAAYERNERERLDGEAVSLAVIDATRPDHLWGGCSIYNVDRDEGRAAVGYWLAHHARGRGIATRTVRLLAGWSFKDLAVQRLELTCAPDNVASQRVAERCGFVRE